MNTTKKVVLSSMFAALVCVATMIIKIPSPLKGYLNFGDCVVLLSGWLLPPAYGFLAAGTGSALADIFSGYIVYAPATFIIKGLMSITAFFVFKSVNKHAGKFISRIFSGILSELIMIFGYYIFEGFLYGFVSSLVNIPANLIQGTAGLIIGIILINLFEKNKIIY